MFRKSLFAASLVAIALASILLASQSTARASGTPPPPGTYDVGGTVSSVNWDSGYIVIRTNKGCFQTIYPTSSTKVTKKSKAAKLSDVVPGMGIRSNNSLTTGKTLTIDLR